MRVHFPVALRGSTLETSGFPPFSTRVLMRAGFGTGVLAVRAPNESLWSIIFLARQEQGECKKSLGVHIVDKLKFHTITSSLFYSLSNVWISFQERSGRDF